MERMSISQQIVEADLGEDKTKVASQLSYLIDIIRTFGWNSFSDNRTIKPNVRGTQMFMRRKAKILTSLFPNCKIPFENLSKQDVVDMINPLFIELWHVQIVGNSQGASLERLVRKSSEA